MGKRLVGLNRSEMEEESGIIIESARDKNVVILVGGIRRSPRPTRYSL